MARLRLNQVRQVVLVGCILAISYYALIKINNIVMGGNLQFGADKPSAALDLLISASDKMASAATGIAGFIAAVLLISSRKTETEGYLCISSICAACLAFYCHISLQLRVSAAAADELYFVGNEDFLISLLNAQAASIATSAFLALLVICLMLFKNPEQETS